MAEVKLIAFTHKEVAEALIRYHGISEGLWGLFVEFGLGAANVTGEGGDVFPAAIVPVNKLGLQRFEKPNNLTVDAAQINPKRETGGKKQHSKKPEGK
jgi:hypothetical protein